MQHELNKKTRLRLFEISAGLMDKYTRTPIGRIDGQSVFPGPLRGRGGVRRALISQVYPASVPVEVFLEDVVELLNGELRGADCPAWTRVSVTNSTGPTAPRWTSPRRSTSWAWRTDDLVLAPRVRGGPFEPQYGRCPPGSARGRQAIVPAGHRGDPRHTAIAIVA